MTRSRTISLAVLLASVVCVYGQTLLFDFVSYDDYYLVYRNEDFLKAPGSLLTSFETHAFTSHRSEGYYYRPLLLVSYILDYHIWRLNPLGYHLMNLLLHLAASFVVYLILESLGARFLPALLGSVLFALHPIQTESVGWVAGRNDVLLGLFIALMAYFYIRYRESGRQVFALASAGSFLLALFTKEAAAFYILLLPAYDLTGRENAEAPQVPWKSRMLVWGAALILLLGYLLVRLRVFGAIIGSESMYGSSPLGTRLALLPGIVSENLGLLLFPHRLSVVRPVEQLIWLKIPWNIAAVVILALFLAAIYLSFKRDRVVCFGLVWLGIGLLPVTGVFPLAVPILEHRLYAVSISLAIIIGRLLDRFAASKVLTVAAVLVIIVAALASALRLPVWKNSETLWTDAIRKAPNTYRSYYNLAGYYYERQEYAKAIDLLKKYMQLRPGDLLGFLNLRQTYSLMGDIAEVSAVSREMIAGNPHDQAVYLDVGRFYESINLTDSAASAYMEGLSVDSTFRQVRFQLGALYERTANYASAREMYRKAAQLAPADPMAYFALGRVYARMGRVKDAVAALREGMKFGEPPEDVRELLRYLETSGGGN